MAKKRPPLSQVAAHSNFSSGRRRLVRNLLIGAFGAPAFLGASALGQSQTPEDAADQALNSQYAWVCPMHPDYTATNAGVCPRCGMLLVRTAPYDVRDYELDFRTHPVQAKAGEKVTLLFRFLRPGSGEVVTEFIPVHTKLFHLFVISQDMQFFEHIHPTMADDGTWSIETTLPKAGYYKVLCDFMPEGGSSQFLARPLVTANYVPDLVTDSAHLVPDSVWKKTDGDITASLSFDPRQFASCAYGHLNYELTDSASGAPVTDLQTYLGAFGHMLIMSEDMRDYVHSHPVNTINDAEREDAEDVPEYIIPPDADLDKIRGGPNVQFDALMPKPGNYRAWVEFKRNDRVHAIAFNYNVVLGSADPVLR